jgi:peroxiredoxin Q/BCP
VLAVGDAAPDFSLTDATGAPRRLSEALAAGPVVLAFLKADCAACNLAFPYLERLHQAYPAGGWTIWGVSQHPARAAEWFARNTGVTFPLLVDADGPDPAASGFPVSRAYDPEATPTIFLLDGGQVRSVQIGFAKHGLNNLSSLVADRLALPTVEIAPEDDGKPSFRPG